ncbi:Murein DD-endopeptidase MepM [Agromyces sp. NDB4Y10]|nr:Murein DD-endopeptidase MepM [Agromyces sp. NDB4Y10]
MSRLLVAAVFGATVFPVAVAPAISAAPGSSVTGIPQTVTVTDDVMLAAPSSEGYAVTTGEEIRAAEQARVAAEQARIAASRMRTASTFVNDPTSAVQWPFPTGVPITDDFGPRAAPCSSCSTMHKGLDMTPGEGTPIGAIAAGTVIEAVSSDYGLGVSARIRHVIDGRTYVSVYAHMQFGSLSVSEGDQVQVGQKIGAVGNTGQSTGPHLHLEIWQDGTTPIDPYAWLTAMVGREN